MLIFDPGFHRDVALGCPELRKKGFRGDLAFPQHVQTSSVILRQGERLNAKKRGAKFVKFCSCEVKFAVREEPGSTSRLHIDNVKKRTRVSHALCLFHADGLSRISVPGAACGECGLGRTGSCPRRRPRRSSASVVRGRRRPSELSSSRPATTPVALTRY